MCLSPKFDLPVGNAGAYFLKRVHLINIVPGAKLYLGT